jgi:hypothetical protein
MLFADVDLTALLQFAQSLLPDLQTVSPMWAGVGAVVLFLLQRANVGKLLLDLVSGIYRRVVKGDKTSPLIPPEDLSAAEEALIAAVIDKIKSVRAAKVVADAAAHEAALKAAVGELAK